MFWRKAAFNGQSRKGYKMLHSVWKEKKYIKWKEIYIFLIIFTNYKESINNFIKYKKILKILHTLGIVEHLKGILEIDLSKLYRI